MNQLPTLYALLDAVEIMILDSMEKPEDREMYFVRTYAPPSGTPMDSANLPKGWDRDSEMDAFMSIMDSD